MSLANPLSLFILLSTSSLLSVSAHVSCAFLVSGLTRSAFDEVLTWEEADAVLVTPVRHTGSPAICPLVGTPRLLRDPTATEEGQESEDESQDAEEEEKAVSSKDESGGTPGATTQDGDGEGTEGLGEDLSSEEGSTSTEHLSEEKEGEAAISGDSRQREGAAAAGGTTASAAASATGADVGADPPSFVYQRRKFVRKRAVSDAARGSEGKREKEEGEEEGSARRGAGDEVADTFELVELPIRWPLGR